MAMQESILKIGGIRAACSAVILVSLPLVCASAPQPAGWVPARWPWSDVKSLELLDDSPVNCLLLRNYSADFVAAATKRGVATLAVITPDGDPISASRNAVAANVSGIVMEGNFPDGTATLVKRAAGGAPVVELTVRSRLQLGSTDPIIGTYQGVWPGVVPLESRVGPTGSVWINTNSGFIRAVRAWGAAVLWVANEPPPRNLITETRYQQAIADAATSGARWVVALDKDFAARLHVRKEQAMSQWKAINRVLLYFEQHPEWRHLRPYGELVLIQDPARGGLVSGGILDMIGVKHMPVRVVPRQMPRTEALQGAAIVVNLDTGAFTASQDNVLREFTRTGGKLAYWPSRLERCQAQRRARLPLISLMWIV